MYRFAVNWLPSELREKGSRKTIDARDTNHRKITLATIDRLQTENEALSTQIKNLEEQVEDIRKAEMDIIGGLRRKNWGALYPGRQVER